VPAAVLIIPLPGISFSNFASRHAAAWVHISTEKLCYQSQFLIGLAKLSILNGYFSSQKLSVDNGRLIYTAPTTFLLSADKQEDFGYLEIVNPRH